MSKDRSFDEVRDEYGALLGITHRTPEQQSRYEELADDLERRPHPSMTTNQHEAYLQARTRVDAMVQTMSPEQLERLRRAIDPLGAGDETT